MTSDDDETAIAGGPGKTTDTKPSPRSTENDAAPPPPAAPPAQPKASSEPKPAPAPPPVRPKAPEGDPNVTQVFRPQRSSGDEPATPSSAPSAKEVTMGEDGTVTDPVVAWLVVVEGPGRGSALPIGYGNNRVGRGAGEQICLDFGDEQISRENHAVVTYDGRHRKFYVQQGGGRNLTHVDDELVMVPVEVKGGETLSVGRTKLRFVPFCGPDFDWQDQ